MDGAVEEGQPEAGGSIRKHGKGMTEGENWRPRLHSWEMRLVAMATAAASHMMRRSEEAGRRGWGMPADNRGGEDRDANEVEVKTRG